MPEWTFLVFAGLIGTMVGSFLNVCILRLPVDESIMFPGSSCPTCENPIAWYDNVPILSWVVLGGKCRRCRTSISVQYPIIEAFTGAIWLVAVWHYGFTPTGVGAALLGTILLGITITDARHMIIPHEFTVGGLAIGIAVAAIQGWPALRDSLIGATAGFGLIWVVGTVGKWWAGRDAMGGGDLWMMTMVGAFVGWSGVILTVFLGAAVGTFVYLPIVGLVYLRLSRRRRSWVDGRVFRRYVNTYWLVPFGVFLAPAAAIAFVFGDTVWAWYLGMMLGG